MVRVGGGVSQNNRYNTDDRASEPRPAHQRANAMEFQDAHGRRILDGVIGKKIVQ
jgi:hypothetical protein